MTLQGFATQVLPDLCAAANPFRGVERELDRLARGFAGWSALDEASPTRWDIAGPDGDGAARAPAP